MYLQIELNDYQIRDALRGMKGDEARAFIIALDDAAQDWDTTLSLYATFKAIVDKGIDDGELSQEAIDEECEKAKRAVVSK